MGKRLLGEEVRNHPLVVRQERALQIEMAGVELAEHGVQVPEGVLFAQGQGAADDGGDAQGTGGDEGPDDHPGALGNELQVVPAKGEGAHESAITEGPTRSWAELISARARWKARVDSAPWFSLTRSGCSPSPQPPVPES